MLVHRTDTLWFSLRRVPLASNPVVELVIADVELTTVSGQFVRILVGNASGYIESALVPSLKQERHGVETLGLVIFDVEELSSRGGSLRLFVKHQDDHSKFVSEKVDRLIEREREFGLFAPSTYEGFAAQVEKTKPGILSLLIEAKNRGDSIVICGAAGKTNPVLNYCGMGADLIEYACDRNPYKHGRYTPGTHISILGSERIREIKPDLVLVLPWNLKDEIMDDQLSNNFEWGGRFVVPIPEARLYEGAPA